MELRVLQYFLAVSREQNISAAAQSLHLTQPTLSRQLKELEQALGARAFGEFMRGYYTEYEFSEADTAGFLAALEPYIQGDAAAQELIRRYLASAR